MILKTLLYLAIATPLSARTGGWPVATPEAHGLRSAPIRELSDRMRTGGFGNIDRLVVKDGSLVWNERFDVDYRSVSRGKRTPIGCGVDACTSAADSVNSWNVFGERVPSSLGPFIDALLAAAQPIGT